MEFRVFVECQIRYVLLLLTFFLMVLTRIQGSEERRAGGLQWVCDFQEQEARGQEEEKRRSQNYGMTSGAKAS